MVRQVSEHQRIEILNQACQSLWRDIRYPVLERGYEDEAVCREDLAAALGHELALEDWLNGCLAIERKPVSLAGVRNALLHVFDHFKPHLSQESRHSWHQLIVNEPSKARSRIHELVFEHPQTSLVTSYYWREDAWRLVNFRYRETWWQFRLTPAAAGGCEWTVISLADVLTQMPAGSATLDEWLFLQRLAVRFANGDKVLYPELLEHGFHHQKSQQSHF